MEFKWNFSLISAFVSLTILPVVIFQVLIHNQMAKPIDCMAVNQHRKRVNQASWRFSRLSWVATANDRQDENHDDHETVGKK